MFNVQTSTPKAPKRTMFGPLKHELISVRNTQRGVLRKWPFKAQHRVFERTSRLKQRRGSTA